MGLIKCPECGKEISDKADVCIGCGFPIKRHITNQCSYFMNDDITIACKKCGEKNNKGDTYCKSCGTKLTDSNNIMFELTDDKKKVSKLSVLAVACSFLGKYSYIGAILAFIDICIRKKDKQYKFSYFAICASIVVMLAVGSLGSSDNNDSSDEPTKIETQTQDESQANTQKKAGFVESITKDGLDKKVAKKAKKILKEKIGFK